MCPKAFDGQPLRDKKLAKGYVVYRFGEDGKDDGGDEKKDVAFIVKRLFFGGGRVEPSCLQEVDLHPQKP